MFENIHHLFVRLEEHLGLSFAAAGLHLDDFIRGDQLETGNQAILSGKTSATEIANSIRILQQIRATAQTVDNATIEQDAKLLEETLVAIMHGNLISKKSHDHRIRGTYNSLSRAIKAIYVHPDMPVYYEGSAMPWVDMAYCLFLFSDQYCACFHREDADAHTEEKCRIMVQHVKQLSRFASEGGFEYFQVASNRLLNYLTTVGMAQTREKIDLLMGESWSYIQLLCLMNSAFRTGRHMRDDHREMLANFKLGRIETRRISEEALKSQSIFIELLRRMAVDGNHPFTFFQMYEFFVKKVPLKDSSSFNISMATANLFVWGSEFLPPIEKYLEQLHLHSNIDPLMEGLAVSSTDLSEAIARFLGYRGGVHGYLKMIDLVYLTEIYIENEETLRKRLGKQSCSVALSNLERLRLSIASLEENINFESIRRLQRSFSWLLSVPVKPTLVRLCGASKVIARKLGKEVDFSVYGDDITLDKKMLSDLRDSITHILRNINGCIT